MLIIYNGVADMLDWRAPGLDDIKLLEGCMNDHGMITSDCTPANIYLLREKYNIKIAERDGFFFRKYTGKGIPGRDGVTFPLGTGDIEDAIEALRKDRAEKGKPLDFIYLSNGQCEELSRLGLCHDFETERGNSDYLYTARHLADLPGRENHRKKNRANRFARMFPDSTIVFVTEYDEKVCKEITQIEEKWFSDQEERIDSAFVEREEIFDACKVWNGIGLIGAVVYTADGIACAMSIAAPISEGYYDILFEKSFGEYAANGGFAYINREFAGYLMRERGAEWINREEDIDLPGLRRAKMSYNPDILFDKYHCRVKYDR